MFIKFVLHIIMSLTEVKLIQAHNSKIHISSSASQQ